MQSSIGCRRNASKESRKCPRAKKIHVIFKFWLVVRCDETMVKTGKEQIIGVLREAEEDEEEKSKLLTVEQR